MDTSITLITPEHHQARGAQAFDEGLGENDHDLPPDSPARKAWQYGWHCQRQLRTDLVRAADGGNIASDLIPAFQELTV